MRQVPPRPEPDLICLSHLRWNFVFQRPQHLMTRCARDRRVFFVEEPIFEPEVTSPQLLIDQSDAVRVVVPHLPKGISNEDAIIAQRDLLDQLVAAQRISKYVLWYYTPMAVPFTDHLSPVTVVYDCMDELSAFKGAPSIITAHENELMRRAALVLTGGQSLFEAKRHLHSNMHPFPSSVDVAHFAQARRITKEPADQAPIPRPRLGFFGVIDERMDLELLDAVAAARPDWHLRDARTDREDRPRVAAAARQYSLPWLETLRGTPAVRRGMGRGAAAVCAERRHAVHQSDQDAGVSRRRPAGRVDVDSRCGEAVRHAGPGANRR
jgi:hypothetical protein